MKRKFLWFILIIAMTFIMTPAACSATGADPGACMITVSTDSTGYEMNKGGLLFIDLSEVFTDSQGHTLTYSIGENDAELKATLTPSGELKVAPLVAGQFTAEIHAACGTDSTVTASATLKITVKEPENGGNPAQYGYDETPADSVKMYVTVSSDGVPLVGNDEDNTVLAHLKIEVPYFDLGLYGLENFYRYHTAGGSGPYTDEELVERPTGMHMFIYITERYYMGLPESACCKGTSGILDYNEPIEMINMNGETAYTATRRAYYLTGGATSTYMEELWGHDENLMYYRNHYFPLMSAGWGSTSDYQLLSDGDTFDVAMFTDWEFYHNGAFCCFDEDSYSLQKGQTLSFTAQKTSTGEMGSGEIQPLTGLNVEVYDSGWRLIGTAESETSEFQYTFQNPGTYYLVGMDPNAGTDSANKAPATAIVRVKDPDSPEDNEAPGLKKGVKAETDSTIREQKDFALKLTEIFADPDGDNMTFTVSIDGGEAEGIDNMYCFHTGDPGTHTLVFSATDEKGKTGDSYTVHLAVTGNQKPVLADPENTSADVSLRVGETAKFDLRGLFRDPDNDDVIFLVRKDDNAFSETGAGRYYNYSPADETETGTHIFSFKAKDDLDAVSEDSYTFRVTIENNDTPDLQPESIKNAKVVLSASTYTYNGKIHKPAIKTVGGRTLAEGTDYTAKWSNASSKNAGTYTVTITGKGNYVGTTKATYKINQAVQKMNVKTAAKTLKVSKLKKKALTVSAISVKKQGGKITYRKLNGSARLKVNARTGKITVSKKTGKGTYKVRVKVISAASTNYKAASKNVTVTIKIKK